MNLSDEQKQFLRENFKETPNLLDLTRKLFEDDSLDGRTKEGRAVRAFLAEASLKYETTKWDKVEDITLTDEQIEFAKAQAKNGLSAFQISELLFPSSNVKDSLRAFSSPRVLREYEPAYVHDSEAQLIALTTLQSFYYWIKKVNYLP